MAITTTVIVEITVLLVYLLQGFTTYVAEGKVISREDYLLARKKLKFLNRPAVKSIKTEYGDIFDCVDIYKQPAFDHPLLKNHTIQFKPTSYPKEIKIKNSAFATPNIALKKGGCPFGTIPIRRTRLQDILQSSSPSNFGKKGEQETHHWATSNSDPGQYYGTQATMNIWNPQVQDHQFSVSQFWISKGPSDVLNTVEGGWIVEPSVFGDQHSRLVVYWTTDNYRRTGCLNLFCPGFVQVSKDLPIGIAIIPTSTYNGSQFEITITAYKDLKTGNWWIAYGPDKKPVGYYPKSIFTSLGDVAADAINWGGEVYTGDSSRDYYPPMGSGHFPDEGFKNSCYIRAIKAIDQTGTLLDLNNILPYEDKPECYKVVIGENKGGDLGKYILFGGDC